MKRTRRQPRRSGADSQRSSRQCRDTLVAFAAKAGAVASDGDGQNSPFTMALMKHIAEPGLDLRIAFGRVRDDVLKAHRQPAGAVRLRLARRRHHVAGAARGQACADPEAEARRRYEFAAQIGTKEAWNSFLAEHTSRLLSPISRARRTAKLSPRRTASAKADDAKRQAEEQAAQKADEFRRQLEEQAARQAEDARQKLSDQARRELEEARQQIAEQAKKRA